jgi:hypothetical protein
MKTSDTSDLIFLFSGDFSLIIVDGLVPSVLSSPRYPHSVFVLCDSEKNGQAPVGICFAISENLLLSCQHFMKGKAVLYTIALVVEKRNGILSFPQGFRRVRVISYNVGMDYAILQLYSKEQHNLLPIPSSVQPVESDVDVKIFHCPLEQFQDTDPSGCGTFTKWTKTGVQLTHHVLCDVSLFKGSSGAPYILRSGEVVAIHVENRSRAECVTVEEDTTVEKALELMSNTINSRADVHSSMAYGLLISKCSTLVSESRRLKVIDDV